jgi:hypothetical protein
MRPGWYSHINDPRVVSYFDGAMWGPVTDGFTLSPEIQRTITPLLPGIPVWPHPSNITHLPVGGGWAPDGGGLLEALPQF